MPTTTTDSWEARAAAAAPYNDYRFYNFRIWYGMVASAWLRLLARNHFAVSPARLPFTMLGFVTSVLNSILNLVQTLIFARRIRACVLEEPPIFIIGHWRTGTTFLHELLMIDERFTAPTTLECFAPADCLILYQLLRHLFNFALPPRRPMDNMPVGWDRPQEDEFALSYYNTLTCWIDVDQLLGVFGLTRAELADGEKVMASIRRLAARANKYAVVRTLAHRDNNHLVATHHLLTGHQQPGAFFDKIASRGDYPCFRPAPTRRALRRSRRSSSSTLRAALRRA